MENVENNNNLETDTFLDSVDLDKDIEKIYELIGDEDLQDEFQTQARLSKLRNQNHKRYHNINILKYKNMPSEFDNLVDDIFELYNYIDPEEILNCSSYIAENTKTLLDNIYRKIERLDKVVSTYLKDITKRNDDNQAKLSFEYLKNLNIDDSLKKSLISKYNDLILYSSYVNSDMYEDLKRQANRQKFISEIFQLLNIEEEKKQNLLEKDNLKILNKQINEEIIKYKNQIQYLEDMMPSNTKYLDNFNNFKKFYNQLIAYDDNDIESAKKAFEILSDELRFKEYINDFEELFTQEIQNQKKEEQFVYEKIGIKNLINSFNYINSNYYDSLDDESKNTIKDIYNRLNSETYDLNELNSLLKSVVKKIWSNTITNVYSFDPKVDYYFLCSNNEFIDERYQAILITKSELEKVNDYEDYQIGFICDYNDNILYITENDDIMTVNNDDMSNLKTPIQLEQEFINFKICNRIALDGYRTKIVAVYFINDGNNDKYLKALDLANTYKLPLIELKKNK